MNLTKFLKKIFRIKTNQYLKYVSKITPNLKLKRTFSQHGQEYLVLMLLGNIKSGYFVEFGAIDGITNSNSYYFEKILGWNGILAEPAKRWHENLKYNRAVHIETDCVFSESNLTLEFVETGKWRGGNTLIKHLNSDNKNRIISEKYSVRTISLNDLLDKFDAPRHIDFLSIDTEGSELEIIRGFNFSEYSFSVICIEHNELIEKRDAIRSILEKNEYVRLPLPQSLTKVDDWYVSRMVFEHFNNLAF
ncbi:MAG: FkbM family methyltransferase [Nitrosomonadales bacterium]|jgi:FkbM family methyltransferase|nr:FkbM family methyltransferase [Nitrosomonadales bacterium]